MKAIMYHYVRKENNNLPHFVYLHVDDFEKQIDYLISKYTILSQKEFDECLKSSSIIKDAIVLTFDDGFSDHFEYVYPVLKKRNLWGIFYIPTKPYQSKKLLDVHRIHYLLGKLGGKQVLDVLTTIIVDTDFIKHSKATYEGSTYIKQNNDSYTSQVKRIINYYIKPNKRTEVLEKLLQYFKVNEAEICKKFYLTKHQINEMIDGGMSIANHGHSHTLFSNLNKLEQRNEIDKSNMILTKLTNGRDYKSFCYPYGGKQSYNENTLEYLKKKNFLFAFSVESRDINSDDMRMLYELPRYDCNEFKYGQATQGPVGFSQ